MAKDCPSCGRSVDGFRCRCGWKDTEFSAVVVDRERYLCAHIDRGQRCANLGTMTSNTRGGDGGPHPGPWYCHQHWGPLRDTGERTDAPTGFWEAVRGLSKPPTKVSGVDWEANRERLAIITEGS